MYNQGDTITFILDYTIDDVPLEEYEANEIEFSIGAKRYTLSGGDIAIDETTGKYAVSISQSDSLTLDSVANYQIRIQKNGEVVSSEIDWILLGRTISKTEI